MMNPRSNRRTFLKHSFATASMVALGQRAARGADEAAIAASATPSEKAAVAADIEPLVRVIEDTPEDRFVGVIHDRIRQGLTYRELLAGTFLAAIRSSDGGHAIYMTNSVHQTGLDLPQDHQWLPVLCQAIGVNSSKQTRLKRLPPGLLPRPERAGNVLGGAMDAFDTSTAEQAIVALARSEGPRAAARRLWAYGLARNENSLAHTAIAVANAFRVLDVIGWKHAESVLRHIVQECNHAPGGPLDRVNLQRAEFDAGNLPGDWTSTVADAGVTRDLVAQFREGNGAESCQRVWTLLKNGKVSARSVWDAVFLTTSELALRFHLGGPSGGARHSVTGVNAMHYAFRTSRDDVTRAYALLEAVDTTCGFLRNELLHGRLLADRSILDIPQVDPPDTPESAVEEIFSLLPPQRFRHWFADQSGQIKAMRLTYAMAGRHSPRHFLQTAHRLICLKAGEAHHYKFPVATFENMEHASPDWRSNILAASVIGLQGTQMEDSRSIEQVRSEFG